MRHVNKLASDVDASSNALKSSGYKFIDVKFFEPTELLNDDLCELLNTKVQ